MNLTFKRHNHFSILKETEYVLKRLVSRLRANEMFYIFEDFTEKIWWLESKIISFLHFLSWELWKLLWTVSFLSILVCDSFRIDTEREFKFKPPERIRHVVRKMSNFLHCSFSKLSNQYLIILYWVQHCSFTNYFVNCRKCRAGNFQK